MEEQNILPISYSVQLPKACAGQALQERMWTVFLQHRPAACSII